MKKTTCNAVLTIAALAALVAVSPANAQSTHMKMDVPFNFLAGDTVMPAGTYTVVLMEASRTMTLEGKSFVKLPVSAARVRRAADRIDDGALKFERVSGVYVLKGVWNRRHVEGCALYPSNSERELARGKDAVTVALEK